jgi:hypothetical protein
MKSKSIPILHEPDTSWLAGNYPELNSEINVRLPYIGIGDYFWQGDEADNVINEIHKIWLRDDCTVEQAIKTYSNYYL